MTAIGFATAVMALGTAIALFSSLTHALMIVMLLLPETRGRAIASLEPEAPGPAYSPAQPAVGRVNPREHDTRQLHTQRSTPPPSDKTEVHR